jgi:hypothetical protein
MQNNPSTIVLAINTYGNVLHSQMVLPKINIQTILVLP